MSFYKNVHTNIQVLDPEKEYPIGDILLYKGELIEVRDSTQISGSFTTDDCKKYCVLSDRCISTCSLPYPESIITDPTCSRFFRKDKRSAVFMRYEL